MKVCPECTEPVRRTTRVIPRTGSMIGVDAMRLNHTHKDGSPLCPVMTASGYQPALPVDA